eukprot:2688529-Amphidinium_carterae.1
MALCTHFENVVSARAVHGLVVNEPGGWSGFGHPKRLCEIDSTELRHDSAIVAQETKLCRENQTTSQDPERTCYRRSMY